MRAVGFGGGLDGLRRERHDEAGSGAQLTVRLNVASHQRQGGAQHLMRGSPARAVASIDLCLLKAGEPQCFGTVWFVCVGALLEGE